MSLRMLVAEIGSCHMGKLDRCLEAVRRCKEAGIDAVKFQLFPNIPKYTDCGNVWLNPEYFEIARNYGKHIGIEVTASVFDEQSFQFLLNLKPYFIKFAYSQKEQHKWIDTTLDAGLEAIVSCDIMTRNKVPRGVTALYCISEYPIKYQVDFTSIFDTGLFEGFSDHTMGIGQTIKAIEAGAEIIEKHVRLGYADEDCPDALFAVTIEEFAKVRS